MNTTETTTKSVWHKGMPLEAHNNGTIICDGITYTCGHAEQMVVELIRSGWKLVTVKRFLNKNFKTA